MKKLIFTFLFLVLVAWTNSLIFAQNPIIPEMNADASIIKVNGVYYCYATTDGYGRGLASSGPPTVWKSNDFVNWSFKGCYFPSANNQVFWAPSKAVAANGKYYLYPTINGSIYVAVSDAPDGPFKLANGEDSFTKTGAAPLVRAGGPKGTKGIDAEIFIDDDGQAYMFWAQRGAARLQKDMITLDTAIVTIPTKHGGYSEGPIFFKRKGIYYYLYTLDGHENYKYAYMYSKTSPLGPFLAPENDIITRTDTAEKIYGPGHGCVFNEPGTPDFYIAYLEFGIGGTNRQTWVDKLEFNPDGTIIPVKLTHEGVGNPGKKTAVKKQTLPAKAIASSSAPDLKVRPITDRTLNRTETYAAQNVLDGSYGTRWMAAPKDSIASITLDFGKTINVGKSVVYFVQPTAGHAYTLEYSLDGKQWVNGGGHSDIRIQSPHSDVLNLKTRYLRISILKGLAGIWEWKVYSSKYSK